MAIKSELSKAKQLLVEGTSDKYLFAAMLDELGVTEIEIHGYGGKPGLRGFLKAFIRTPGFDPRDARTAGGGTTGGVSSLGIVRDADDDPGAAFQSVRDALLNVNLPAPDASGQVAEEENRRVSIMILPDNGGVGMLETVCLASVADDPAMECVDDYVECLRAKLAEMPANLEKARLQTFLASRRKPGLLLGQAAAKGYWQWDHAAFNEVKSFVQAL